MRFAEFEEREFELYLYRQLRVGNNQAWSPGQVLEHHLGFDFSALCVDSYFWAMQGIASPYEGALLEDVFRKHFWRTRRPFARRLPNFSLNLFIQAKRPEIRLRLTKALKGRALRAPYWRFSLDPNQQRILETLANLTRGRCLVCYAAPAFDRWMQLEAHALQGTIVANSSFPAADQLAGHAAWNYDSPGASGVANAEPEEIRGEVLSTRIGMLISESRTSETGYEENLAQLVKDILTSINENPDVSSDRRLLLHQRIEDIDYYLRGSDTGRYRDAIRNFIAVLAFAETYRMQWYVLGLSK